MSRSVPISERNEQGIELVTTAANLVGALHEWRDDPSRDARGNVVRLVYVFLRKLLPGASRDCIDALAELIVLELLRGHLASGASAADVANRPQPISGHEARIVEMSNLARRTQDEETSARE